MSDVVINAKRLLFPIPRVSTVQQVEPLEIEFANALLAIARHIDGKPGDPGQAYPLADRVDRVLERYEQDAEDARRVKSFY